MNNVNKPVDVGSPDPELKNSPIVEEMDDDFDVMAQTIEKMSCCYFNDKSYDLGTYVCSGSGELLRCENGIWVQEGTCDTDNL